jgi:hypothetical protein
MVIEPPKEFEFTVQFSDSHGHEYDYETVAMISDHPKEFEISWCLV